MPKRKIPLATNHYYHILNRSFNKKIIFPQPKDKQRFINLLNYYRFKNAPLPFSKFNNMPKKLKIKILTMLKKKDNKLIDIIAFCLMPNHFHLLLKQNVKNGIVNFLTNIQNSYAKFFNTKYKLKGPVFYNRFKAVLTNSNEQLLHLSRYIHLNPYSSSIVKSKKELLLYPWSSLPQYLNKTKGFCHPQIVLGQFANSSEYQQFVLNQANYQKELDIIKHLFLQQDSK